MNFKDPWLVAAWPGMGNVAVGAAWYLINKLGARPFAQLHAAGLFDPDQVQVKRGLLQPLRLPSSTFFGWHDPRGERDLIIFVGEEQPTRGTADLAAQVAGFARQLGATRIVTFAAMATELQPGTTPRSFAFASSPPVLSEALGAGAEPMEEGAVSGMNGILLASAVEQGMDGLCLLGEVPGFVQGLPNPDGSRVVLDRFARVSGIEVDLSEIAEQARNVNRSLDQLLTRIRSAVQPFLGQGEDGEEGPPWESLAQALARGEVELDDDEADEEAEDEPEAPTPELRARIETLFRAARADRADRSRALALKATLDEHGLFPEYEDRFLDLFRRPAA